MMRYELFTQIIVWLYEFRNVVTTETEIDKLQIKLIYSGKQFTVRHVPYLTNDELRYSLQYPKRSDVDFLEIYYKDNEWFVESLGVPQVFSKQLLLSMLF